MARPRTVEDALILDAARTVFRRVGASGSLDEIASLVGLSGPALQKRYGTKEALFLAAMTPPPLDAAEIVRKASEGREPRKALTIIAERALDYFRTAIPLMLPFATHPTIGAGGLRQHMEKNPVHALRRAIIFYLHDQGWSRISAANINAAADLLVSSLAGIALLETLGFEGEGAALGLQGGGAAKTRVTGLVQAFWQGLRPSSGSGS